MQQFKFHEGIPLQYIWPPLFKYLMLWLVVKGVKPPGHEINYLEATRKQFETGKQSDKYFYFHMLVLVEQSHYH